ncbi:tetratricopeptide repeat protein [Azoarcus indigens]|uniref:Uncharacterized protein DUF4440 n=1 Tax=Azoarcus indigens TaxID=29545 RepID=A0A4R6DVR5_9RHOO|nr:tetratricopeptide repeat protein [Azoarcus indigens]NMG64286.1 tetratricopeptide repeat protein [Azoarcus indigens]TDN49263.1 uncharacterized protein DUF4440 [Azoarcus indigens]
MRIRPSLASGALSVALLVGMAPVQAADGVKEMQSLIRAGKPAEALSRADKLIAASPRDPQPRFLKGVALAELGKREEAIAVFQQLTQDFPALPEPYNNLAVLYAQQKEYDKARTTLERALRTHPSYATAHQNLGDLYAQLATQAYGKALQMDSTKSADQSTRLALLAEMTPAASAPLQQLAAAPPAPVVAEKPPEKVAAEKPAPEVKVEPKPAPAPSVPPAPPKTPTVETPRPAAPQPSQPAPERPAPPKPAEPPATPAANPTKQQEAAVLKAAEAWAKAWSTQDVKGYLSHYDRDFQVPNNRPRQEWEREREQRIARPGAISVEIENARISLNGDRATLRFRQHYRSSGFNGSTNKTLEFVRRGEQWRILRESVGN